MPIDLATETGALEFAESKRREMERCFEVHGRFEMNGYSFGAYVFTTHEVIAPMQMPPPNRPIEETLARWKTGARLPQPKAELCRLPEWVRLFVRADQHTAFFGSVLRALNEKSRAIGTVVMGKSWLAMPEHVPGETAEQARAKLPASLEDYEGRREGLFLRLEHKLAAGGRMWTNEITRNPTSLGEWKLFDEAGDGSCEGRLVDLIPRGND